VITVGQRLRGMANVFLYAIQVTKKPSGARGKGMGKGPIEYQMKAEIESLRTKIKSLEEYKRLAQADAPRIAEVLSENEALKAELAELECGDGKLYTVIETEKYEALKGELADQEKDRIQITEMREGWRVDKAKIDDLSKRLAEAKSEAGCECATALWGDCLEQKVSDLEKELAEAYCDDCVICAKHYGTSDRKKASDLEKKLAEIGRESKEWDFGSVLWHGKAKLLEQKVSDLEKELDERGAMALACQKAAREQKALKEASEQKYAALMVVVGKLIDALKKYACPCDDAACGWNNGVKELVDITPADAEQPGTDDVRYKKVAFMFTDEQPGTEGEVDAESERKKP